MTKAPMPPPENCPWCGMARKHDPNYVEWQCGSSYRGEEAWRSPMCERNELQAKIDVLEASVKALEKYKELYERLADKGPCESELIVHDLRGSARCPFCGTRCSEGEGKFYCGTSRRTDAKPSELCKQIARERYPEMET